MKLHELLDTINKIAIKHNIATPMICGGAVREKVMGTLTKLNDIDITNGEPTIKNLAKEVELELSKNFSITSQTMGDGHVSLFLAGLKIDFSSNFILPNIDEELAKIGINNPNNVIRECYSRDFTCNSLLMDFNLKKVIDPTKKGISDINNKIIRTCAAPDITLKYNLNRIIRVIYLAAKLDFKIDEKIIEFIQNNKQLIDHINSNYITNTLNKAITYNIDKTALILDNLDLWKSIPISEKLYPYYAKRFKTASKISASIAKPSKQDLMDAIQHADLYGTEDWKVEDFDLKFEGNLSVNELYQFDDLNWMDVDPNAKEHGLDELDSFRGKEWAKRAREWQKTGIPPIVVITAPTPYEENESKLLTQIGDGRGRVNFAAIMNLKIPVWHLIYKPKAKTAQLRKNLDIGESFYSNMNKYKSVLNYLKKNKKHFKKIKNKKSASFDSNLYNKLNKLRPQFANAAQKIIYSWHQDDEGYDEEYGSGGICDQISRALSDIVAQHIDAEIIDGGHDGDDHAYIIVYNDHEAFAVDIPPGLYETGGGYNWRKIQNAKVDSADIDIWKINRKDLGDIEKNAYYNGIDDYLIDNFPILVNDDLETNMDRKENDPANEIVEEKDGEEGGDTGTSLLNPSDFSGSMYSSMHGDEGLFTIPLSEHPGRLTDEQEAVVNNKENPLFQSNGLFESLSMTEMASLFCKLAIK